MKKITKKSIFFSLKLSLFGLLLLSLLSAAILLSPADILLNADIGRTASLAAAVMGVRIPADTAYTLPVIVIDAGHGGEDGGASGFGLTEKDLNLAIAKKLQAVLQSLGMKAVMTRDTDVLLYDAPKNKKMQDLRSRVRMAEEAGDAVFISIHQNKFPVEKYTGCQVYYSSGDARSRIFAGMIQSTVKLHLQPENTRSIKEAGSNIYVLDKLKIPAVLIECGFLSNRAEAEKLKSNEYQMQLVSAVAAALVGYLSIDTSA